MKHEEGNKDSSQSPGPVGYMEYVEDAKSY